MNSGTAIAATSKNLLKRLAPMNWALADQAILSAFNFALLVSMVRFWTPQEFGTFSLIYAVALFGTGLQNAFITTPMAVLRARASTDHMSQILDCLWTANLVLISTLVALTFLFGLATGLLTISFTMLLVVFLATFLLREFARGYLFSTLSTRSILLVDLAQIFLAICALLITVALGRPLTLPTVILALSVSYLLPALWVLMSSSDRLDFRLRFSWRSAYAEIWPDSKWALLGVVTTEIQSRGYIYIVSLIYGPSALALLQAGRIIFAPIGLMVTAWGRVARVQLAHYFAAGKQREATRLLMLSALCLGASALILIGLVGAFWPFFDAWLFAEKYPAISLIVQLWACIMLISLARSIASIAMQASNRFRALARATLAGAITALIVLLTITQLADHKWVLLSVILGDCVALVLITRGMRRSLQPSTEG